MPDPKYIESKHNGPVTFGGVTVRLSIHRRSDKKVWCLEVIDEDDNSVTWDEEFDTDDDAHAEFLDTVRLEGLDGILETPTLH
jgi:hypothetical protein